VSAGGKFRATVDDRVWRKLRRKVRGIADVRVKVGVVGSGAGQEHGGSTLAEIAAVHEYGSEDGHIPMRSFVRRTFELQLDELRGMQARVAKGLLSGKLDVDKGFGLLGLWGANAIKNTIRRALVEPKLQESEAGRRTIERKGSSLTLVDTGMLINGITWAVTRGSGDGYEVDEL
jgi:hypothetical protein